MTELALLGSLLGLPSIFDPMFPATYASFFGSYPPWMEETQYAIATKTEKQETDENKPMPVSASSNVCIVHAYIMYDILLCATSVCLCILYLILKQ